ncbi:uncharacterized protein TrAtP1_006625 [Trichoderma atroviride]|uniref:uncharacterized protein n=1 Tax=Hypocrea atroviridis TaxID=63577 RepID=UPI003322B42C|nr:hypothetical protein TrAtP1_006625 [Trichoderma atroviride]
MHVPKAAVREPAPNRLYPVLDPEAKRRKREKQTRRFAWALFFFLLLSGQLCRSAAALAGPERLRYKSFQIAASLVLWAARLPQHMVSHLLMDCIMSERHVVGGLWV